MMEGIKEIMVAIPDDGGDIYRRHQLLWRAMHARQRRGSTFIFAALAPRIMQVRGVALDRGAPSTLCAGDLCIDLVVAKRDNQQIHPLADSDLPDWIRALLHNNGFEMLDLSIENRDEVVGWKQHATTGQRLKIKLPVASLRVQTRVVRHAHASLAWAYGISRGRRFGYGMLRRAN